MSGDDETGRDAQEHDVVMPGFRFHPTEEELIEFYLRRKVEGRRFHVDLITSVDLYRYDPWELPAMAAVGEQQWFFYVPRNRKYRNGDRPNRVTASGYWKATGADRTIRGGEGSVPIGLKKTLVFYAGKAPKGLRSCWIMHEYRLPPPEPGRTHAKAEISLCRVYKRTTAHYHRHPPAAISHKATPSSTAAAASENPIPNHPLNPPLMEEEYPSHASPLSGVDELNGMISYLNQPRLLPLQNLLPPPWNQLG